MAHRKPTTPLLCIHRYICIFLSHRSILTYAFSFLILSSFTCTCVFLYGSCVLRRRKLSAAEHILATLVSLIHSLSLSTLLPLSRSIIADKTRVVAVACETGQKVSRQVNQMVPLD